MTRLTLVLLLLVVGYRPRGDRLQVDKQGGGGGGGDGACTLPREAYVCMHESNSLRVLG